MLHESLYLSGMSTSLGERSEGDGEAIASSGIDSDLAMALRLSELEQKERQLEIERETKMLEEILKLSLQEK